MAQEGIMALPMGAGMQERQGNRVPSVTSADSYDAATTAQGMVDPQSLAVMKESIRQNIADLELTTSELDMLIEMFEYMSQRPDQYSQLVEQLVQQDIVDEGDMPEDYDPEFIGAILVALNEIRLMRGENAVAPMMVGPGAAPAGPMPMARGGLAEAAQYLASRGRNGDTMLAHITPEEAYMLKSMGGSGTINPETGLPEFFLKKAFKSITKAVKNVLKSPVGRILGTIALATVLGPAGVGLSLGSTAAMSTAINMGLASAGTTLLGGGSVKEALIAGAMGYIGGGGTILGANPVSAVSGYLPSALPGAVKSGLATGLVGTGVGLVAGMKPADALRMGAQAGLVTGAMQGLQNAGVGRSDQAVRDAEIIASSQRAAAPAPAQGATSAGSDGGIGSLGTAQDLLGGPRVQLPPGASAETDFTVAGSKPGPGLLDRAITGAKDFYTQYLSPSRSSLPTNAGILQKYGPLALAGTAVAAAAGGMKGEPANPNPLFNRDYTGRDFIRDNPEMFRGGLDRPVVPAPIQLVPTPSYAAREISNIPIVLPAGVTRSPAGVAQPYNVEGLYGVPLLYGPPSGRAKGGEMSMADFPRKTGTINGPGTGTSDSIPAMLSDGEFVFTAKAVRNAGNGSRRKGAARMYKLMKKLEGGLIKAK